MDTNLCLNLRILSSACTQKDDGQRWHGEFSANYIEEVTHKTGNFKKFSVFAKMLASSLRQVMQCASSMNYANVNEARHRRQARASSSTF